MYSGHVHQMDLVTPRYITGFGKIVSINRVDTYSGEVNLNQYLSKGSEHIIEFVVDDCQTYCIPRFLQIDNEASFKGSLYHPRTFGKLTRFCLNFGIEIIFIPFSEPWRNGFIESFNSRFDERLWRTTNFKDLKHLQMESQLFKKQHNLYQKYKKELLSKQNNQNHETRIFPKEFTFNPNNTLPITKGQIHFIRLVQENARINILNESFYIKPELSFEYVWATINTKEQQLHIYHKKDAQSQFKPIKTFEYKIREQVKSNIKISKFC